MKKRRKKRYTVKDLQEAVFYIRKRIEQIDYELKKLISILRSLNELVERIKEEEKKQ